MCKLISIPLAPILLKPIAFWILSSAICLNTLGFGLPSCGICVTLPNSKKPKPKLEPEQQKQRGELLSAKEFVKKYQREVKTAAWDPKVLRKCGRGAEQILMSLGAHQHKEKVPLREQARRKKLHQEQAELEGQYRRDIKRKKKK